jgi:hypothetical protein
VNDQFAPSLSLTMVQPSLLENGTPAFVRSVLSNAKASRIPLLLVMMVPDAIRHRVVADAIARLRERDRPLRQQLAAM